MSDPVLLIDREPPLAVVTLNRPDQMNALNAALRIALGETLASLETDPEIRAIVLTGAGRAFCAGMDLKEIGGGQEGQTGYDLSVAGQDAMRAGFEGFSGPVIAAVNGAAIGLGCDVACLADIRMASERAIFGATFLKLGLVPGDGGAWLLPRVIGMSRASELLYAGNTIDAATAEAWGLVSRVVPHESLLEQANALAESISCQPRHALRFTKSLMRQGQTSSYENILEMSAALQAVAHLTDDHMEGVTALLEKRAPEFKGR